VVQPPFGEERRQAAGKEDWAGYQHSIQLQHT
jgi:hypothetical protein